MFRALLDKALSCVTCWGQPHCHSKPGHTFSHSASIYSLEKAEDSFSMFPLLGHTCRGVPGPSCAVCTWLSHTHSCPDNPRYSPYRAGFQSRFWFPQLIQQDHGARAVTLPDTHIAQNLQGCMLYTIFFCSPSYKTTDTTTETHLSKTQILLLLLFIRMQEKSLVLLDAFMSICTLHCGIYLCWVFPTTT